MAGITTTPKQFKNDLSKAWIQFDRDIKDKQQLEQLAAIKTIIRREGAIKGERLA